MKTDANALIGSTFNEMYRILRPIGTGGMGAVYEAVHTRLANKKFAIKMLHASIAQDAEVFQRFRREAEIATELGHPHIVEVHDFNITPDGSPYMVMEYLEGEDLASRLQKRGPMALETMIRLVAEISSGLEAAHGAGIVHRDLKPPNIFLCKKLGRDDFVKIVDFGISKVKDSSSVVTRDHSLMGTPFYMSPEQADGLVQQIDHRTDIFALGAILWEMLTGRMAFEAPTISGAMYKVVHVDAPEVHTIRPDVAPAVSLVLRRAMAKQKDWRYGSMTELSYEFANACRGIMPSVAPPPMIGQMATMAPTPQIMAQMAGASGSHPAHPASGSQPPRAQTPAPVHGNDAYAKTGYIPPSGQGFTPPPGQQGFTPPPGQFAPPQGQFGPPPGQQGFTPPPGQFAPPQGQFGPPPGQQGFTPPPGQFAPPQGQFGPPPGQQGFTPPPGQFAPPPHTPYPPTAVPQQMMAPPPVQPQQMMTPPPVAPVAPVSTLGTAASQIVPMSTMQTGPKKSKAVVYGAIAAIVLLAGGAGFAVSLLGKKDDKAVSGAGGPSGPTLTETPDAAPIAKVVPPVTPPDAAVAVVIEKPVEKPVVPVVPLVEEVTITFDVQYEKGKAPAKPAALLVFAEQPVTGPSIKVKKGSERVRLDVTEKGYTKVSLWVVPDGDKTVSAVLKKKVTAGDGPTIGPWVP